MQLHHQIPLPANSSDAGLVSLIIKFMIPMCLGNLFQQFYNIADSIVAGNFIGVNALAAIGSTGSLMFFVTGWLNGLSSGFAIIVAQMFGAKKFDRMRHYVAMSIYLMAAFSIDHSRNDQEIQWRLGMGVEGCGYATVIAQGISAVCCLIYIVKRFPILHLERKDFEICWDSFGRLLKLGIPMGLQFSITAIGTIIVQSAVNKNYIQNNIDHS